MPKQLLAASPHAAPEKKFFLKLGTSMYFCNVILSDLN